VGFASTASNLGAGGGRYTGTLSIGSTF